MGVCGFGRVIATGGLFSMLAFALPAHAQTVLERVLDQVDGVSNVAPVNGVYANIAENMSEVIYDSITVQETIALEGADPGAIFGYVLSSNGGDMYPIKKSDLGTIIPSSRTGFSQDLIVSRSGVLELVDVPNPTEGFFVFNPAFVGGFKYLFQSLDPVAILSGDELVYSDGKNSYLVRPADAESTALLQVFRDVTTTSLIDHSVSKIDGSITNVVSGMTVAAEDKAAGATGSIAYHLPAIDFGDMATTALGAVNTGDITLGIESAVDDARTASSQAVESALVAVGGNADTGTLMLNVAHNAGAVQGDVNNALTGLNGTVANISTTALGAVNTGTIVNGVHASVAGITGIGGS